jgi:FkbM family methyltransferase
MQLLQYFSIRLSALLDQVYFVEIGAFKGKSTLYPIINAAKWQGIMVEPVPEHFDQLQKNFSGVKGLHFVNAAINDTRGALPFYRVDPEFVQRQGSPDWLDKIGSLSRRHLVEHEQFHAGISQHIITTEVRAITLSDLLEQHPLPRIDLLQIDAEKKDFKILRQFDFKQFQPYIIHFEHIRLSEEEQRNVIRLFLKNNYFIKTVHLKLLAVHPKLFRMA